MVRKVVILAGGLGTRISEETQLKPKPMIEIGGRPILWHIMKMYAHHGVNEFIICCGYRGYVIKEYFANFSLHMSDVTFDLSGHKPPKVHSIRSEDWKVTLVDTGDHTMTGGRLARVREHVENEEAFAFTYGDGLSDIDLTSQFQFHKSHGKLATVAAVTPPGRFGSLKIEDDSVVGFQEKPHGDGGKINGGFFVLSPKCINLIDGDDVPWERAPMERLAQDRQLCAFDHQGFWQPMDTLRERTLLEELWSSEKAPWKTWA